MGSHSHTESPRQRHLLPIAHRAKPPAPLTAGDPGNATCWPINAQLSVPGGPFLSAATALLPREERCATALAARTCTPATRRKIGQVDGISYSLHAGGLPYCVPTNLPEQQRYWQCQ